MAGAGSRRKKANVAETSRFSSPRKKAKVAEEVGEEQEHGQAVDRFTSLPDPILVSILSHLPTRDAVKTLMIPRLGHLWDQTLSLDFDWSSSHTRIRHSRKPVNFESEFWRFFVFVNRAMNLHRSPKVSKFRLKLDCASSYVSRGDRLTNLTERIDAWLESAARKNVETLDLDFIDCSWLPWHDRLPWYGYTLPASVLRSSSLVELRLVGGRLRIYRSSGMKMLKYMYLKHISLSEAKINSILSVCPVLEKLSLEHCRGFYKASCRSPMLKTLAISVGYSYSQQQITLSGPYIASLYISGWIKRIDLSYLPSLDDATLNITDDFFNSHNAYVSVKKVFQNLWHAKVLTLHEWIIVVAMFWELKGIQCPSFNCQCLVLRTMLNRWYLRGVANLLRNSPSLETLDLHILPGVRLCCPVSFLRLHWHDFNKRQFWTPKDDPFYCLKNSLKCVKISGDIMKYTAVKFVQFLLSKALVLEKLIIFVDKRLPETIELKKYKENVLNFPVASSKVVVMFH